MCGSHRHILNASPSRRTSDYATSPSTNYICISVAAVHPKDLSTICVWWNQSILAFRCDHVRRSSSLKSFSYHVIMFCEHPVAIFETTGTVWLLYAIEFHGLPMCRSGRCVHKVSPLLFSGVSAIYPEDWPPSSSVSHHLSRFRWIEKFLACFHFEISLLSLCILERFWN